MSEFGTVTVGGITFNLSSLPYQDTAALAIPVEGRPKSIRFSSPMPVTATFTFAKDDGLEQLTVHFDGTRWIGDLFPDAIDLFPDGHLR